MVGSAKQTVAVYLRIDLIEEVKRRKLNMSQLVNDLLEQYLFGNSNQISEEMLKLKKLEEKLAEIEKAVSKLDEIKKELEELRSRVEEKQEEKEIEDNLPLIRELREIVFDDLANGGYEQLESFCRMHGRDPKDAIKTRLSAWAAEKGISYPQAVRLFCKAFPDLKHLFEVVEVRA